MRLTGFLQSCFSQRSGFSFLSVLLLLAPSSPVFAAADKNHVYCAEEYVPYECKNASVKKAAQDLGNQCREAGMRLDDMWVRDCRPSGDDGGYVSYVKVTYEGVCE